MKPVKSLKVLAQAPREKTGFQGLKYLSDKDINEAGDI